MNLLFLFLGLNLNPKNIKKKKKKKFWDIYGVKSKKDKWYEACFVMAYQMGSTSNG